MTTLARTLTASSPAGSMRTGTSSWVVVLPTVRSPEITAPPGADLAAVAVKVTRGWRLESKNAKRDEHLRSADFFDSKSHPRVTFIATGARAAPGGAMISGELTVGKHTTRLEVPVVIERAGEDEVTVRAGTVIPRKDVGLTWNKMGMIKSDARLDIELRLIAGA